MLICLLPRPPGVAWAGAAAGAVVGLEAAAAAVGADVGCAAGGVVGFAAGAAVGCAAGVVPLGPQAATSEVPAIRTPNERGNSRRGGRSMRLSPAGRGRRF